MALDAARLRLVTGLRRVPLARVVAASAASIVEFRGLVGYPGGRRACLARVRPIDGQPRFLDVVAVHAPIVGVMRFVACHAIGILLRRNGVRNGCGFRIAAAYEWRKQRDAASDGRIQVDPLRPRALTCANHLKHVDLLTRQSVGSLRPRDTRESMARYPVEEKPNGAPPVRTPEITARVTAWVYVESQSSVIQRSPTLIRVTCRSRVARDACRGESRRA